MKHIKSFEKLTWDNMIELKISDIESYKKIMDLFINNEDVIELIAKVDNKYADKGETIQLSNYNAQYVKNKYPDDVEENLSRACSLPFLNDRRWISIGDILTYFL